MTEVDVVSALVATGKVAVLAPAGTVTLAGTWAAEMLLERKTCAPPEGAAVLRVTVPVEDCVPPTTLVGLNAIDVRVGSGGGRTLSVAV